MIWSKFIKQAISKWFFLQNQDQSLMYDKHEIQFTYFMYIHIYVQTLFYRYNYAFAHIVTIVNPIQVKSVILIQ